MKKGFLIMLLFSTVFLGQVREDVYNGELILHVNILNLGAKDADDLRVSVYVPNLALFYRTNRFDLDDGEKAGKFVFLQLSAPPGAYLTKITLSSSNDGILDTKYIYTLV